jgi:hypothetical protein
MHKLYEDLTEICEVLADELNKTNDKLEKSGGQISAGDLDYIDKLTHALKSVKTTKAMMEAEEDGYSYDDMSYERGRSNRSGSYERGGSYRGNSYARGRGTNARRDSRGRYSSRGYSRDDDMIMELRELMQDAPDEHTRMEFQKFISKMESM